jgi:hypothetical protein
MTPVSPLCEWTVYRTRFLVRARQLDSPLSFVDALGREHSGRTGDYLVESPDGTRRIAPKEIFEDIYVRMDPPDASIQPVNPDPDVGRALLTGSTIRDQRRRTGPFLT